LEVLQRVFSEAFMKKTVLGVVLLCRFLMRPGTALYFTSAGIKLYAIIFSEVISKKGFWLKFKAGPNFNPQAYCSIPRS